LVILIWLSYFGYPILVILIWPLTISMPDEGNFRTASCSLH